jgi:hypothetical protein
MICSALADQNAGLPALRKASCSPKIPLTAAATLTVSSGRAQRLPEAETPAATVRFLHLHDAAPALFVFGNEHFCALARNLQSKALRG